MIAVGEAIKQAQAVMTSVLDSVVGGANTAPPVTKLSEGEQLRRYYRMKPEHLESLRKKYGTQEVDNYISAMENMARRVL